MFEFVANNKRYIFDEEKLCIYNGTKIKYLSTDNKEEQGYIYIKLSSSCNLRCTYCFQNLYSSISERVDFKKFKKLILKLIDLDRDFVLYGGEPFLNENINFIDELMSILPINSRRVRSFSNGCFSKEILSLLNKHKTKLAPIVISIDGPPRIHNERRIGVRGDTFDIILDNLAKMQLQGIDFIVQINIDKNNIDYLDSILAILSSELENEVDVLINPVMHSEFAISEPDLLQAFINLCDKYSFCNVAVNSVILNRLSSILINKGIIKSRCYMGKNWIFDFEKLEIYTCTSNQETVIGTFSDSEFRLYNEEIARYSNLNNCNEQCKYKNICSLKCIFDNDGKSLQYKCAKDTAKSLKIIFDNFEKFFRLR